MSAAHRTLLATLALAALQIIVFYTRMPATMASHFDGAGVPNGWSSRFAFFALYAAMLALIYVCFVVVPRWHRARERRRGVERWRDEVFASLERRLAWLGAVHVALMIATVQLVIRANLEQQPLSTAMYWLLGAYFVFLALWLLSWFAYVRSARG